MYRSPFCSYDISNYEQIYAPYGTLQDWDDLRDALHSRGMKIMMDLVVNHTSDQHKWFQESRKSKDSPYRDWYFWKPARKGPNGERLPPNNWAAVFGKESAWAWDEATQVGTSSTVVRTRHLTRHCLLTLQEYYLHLYVTEQPDLNWDNPKVREAVFNIMKFWLDRGCDGFRMVRLHERRQSPLMQADLVFRDYQDVINLISKTPGLPDAKELVAGEFLQPSYEHTANG